MNGVELFLLGRTLMKIGEQALPSEGLGNPRPVLIVVADLRENGESSVGEIAARTGLPQSAVSGAVARLREAGSVVTEPDPADRRRLLVRPAKRASRRVAEVRSTSIETALAEALDDPAQVDDVVATLESLATRLRPGSASRPTTVGPARGGR